MDCCLDYNGNEILELSQGADETEDLWQNKHEPDSPSERQSANSLTPQPQSAKPRMPMQFKKWSERRTSA